MHYIERVVIDLIKKHKTTDPFEICDAKGIKYNITEMHEEINGLYQFVQRNKFIYINSLLSEDRRLYTCYHELAHAVVHETANCIFLKTNTLFNLNKFEKEAEYLVACFLIRDPSILFEFTGHTLDEIAYELKVPKEYVQLRLEYLNFT